MDPTSNLRFDKRFLTNALRVQHRSDLLPILQTVFATKPAHEWLTLLAAAKIPSAPVNGVREALENIQSESRGLIIQLEHPMLGAIKIIANPIRLSDTPVSYRLPPPLLGEQSTDILRELGYSASDASRILAGHATGTTSDT